MIAGTVAVALGAGEYLQSSNAGSAPPEQTVDQKTVAEPHVAQIPRRMAAATPLDGYQPLAVEVTRTDAAPGPILLPAAEPAAEGTCPVTVDLFADADAMLALTLTAPCRPNEGVVLRHAGLSVTYMTTATGSLFVDIPALDMKGEVTVRFPDGTEVAAAAPVPELAEISRFALQWIDGDSFNLSTDAPVVQLGTATTALPMYALVATLPDQATPIAIEAPINAENCGREALGAAYFSEGGTLAIADLTMALPECDSEGGFVVLNNPIADMKLAAAE
jgi:hypothetical protein